MVFARLLFPGSKLSLKTVSADSALAASCGLQQEDLDEDRLYRAMDALSGNWARIEKGLYREVPLVLKELQQIKVGKLRAGHTPLKMVLTKIPARLYTLLNKLNLVPLFRRPPVCAS